MYSGIVTNSNDKEKYLHLKVYNHRKYCSDFSKFLEEYLGIAEEITDTYIVIKVKLNDNWRKECTDISEWFICGNKYNMPEEDTLIAFDSIECKEGFLHIKCHSCLLLHEEIHEAIKNVTMHPVRMELIFDDKFDWNRVIWPEMTKVTVYTDRIGNKDHRGGGCGNSFVKFDVEDFTWTAKKSDGITLKEMAECIYRIKGSKYDYWYELYGGILLKKTDGKHLTYYADFGYGS